MPSVTRAAGLALTGLFVAVLATSAEARFKMPDNVPVERLVENLGARLAEDPDDAKAHYVLARVHSLALTRKSANVHVYLQKDDLPFVDHQFHGSRGADGEPLAERVLRGHLASALHHFGEAIRLEPGSGRTHLGLAYTLEVGGLVALVPPPGTVTPQGDEKARLERLTARLGHENAAVRESARNALVEAGGPAVVALVPRCDDADPEIGAAVREIVAAIWRERAIREYLRAFELSVEEDVKIEYRPIRGLRSLVSYEAGTLYQKLVAARGVRDSEKPHMARTKKALEELDEKPRGPITPIVFPLDRTRPLASLLDPAARVQFDLDGDGAAREWPWVRGDTGILVWDGDGTVVEGGRVASGRQLFGSVTWWMFWDDGYRALDALDDDRDGWLAGEELRGLAVWRDADQDGSSDPGEVVSAGVAGVTGLCTRPSRPHVGVPWSARGVRFEDGRELPTYDWIVSPVRADQRSQGVPTSPE